MEKDNIFEEPKSEYNQQKDFTSLICWKDARKMKIYFYKIIIPLLPELEKYNLNTQIRKASVSSTANIAEGYGRYHYQEGIQFYRISRGSIYELKDHLISCFDFDYINQELFDEGINLIESTKIKLNGYIKYVQKLKETDRKQKRS